MAGAGEIVERTLTAMIAPALFMAAGGLLISATAQWTGLIVERIRVLVDLGWARKA